MARKTLDSDGQPNSDRIGRLRRSARDVDELIGLCKGLAADGRINDSEATFLNDWLRLSAEAKEEWPGDLLYARMQEFLVDGRIDDKEERELLDLLIKVSGGNAAKLNAASLSAGLPVTTPLPKLEFQGRKFCFTGKFVFGSRERCEGEVVARGGGVQDSVSKSLDFLVIGVVGSRDWLHSSFGRKIEKAVTLRNSGAALAIVPEEHFVSTIRA